MVASIGGVMEPNQQFSVYPNPATNKINVLGIASNQQIEIYNISGGLVLIGLNDDLDVSHLKSGIYLLRTEGVNQTVKFIKK